MFKTISVQSIFVVTALTLFTACGKGKTTVTNVNPAPPPVPTNNYNSTNTQTGCVGGVNTQQTFANFGGGYDIVRYSYMPSYQCWYGNITLSSAASIGQTSIPAGSYSWVDMYDRITAATQACLITQNTGTSFWAGVNYGSFSATLSNQMIGSCTISNNAVTLQRSGMVSDFLNIYMAIAQMNSTYYYNAYHQYGHGYYYGPSSYYGNLYYGSGSGTTIGGGLSYNSGGGLSFSLGGIFNR